MKTSQFYLITMLALLFTSNFLQGQNNNDQLAVKKIYEAIENNDHASVEIATLIERIDWDNVGAEKAWENEYRITFSALLKNNWENILFKNLEFQIPEKNKVVVTGIVYGRQPAECEYISTPFKHYWSLENGKIVNFIE